MSKTVSPSHLRGPLSHIGVLSLSLLILFFAVTFFAKEIDASKAYETEEKVEIDIEDNTIHMHKEKISKTPEGVKKESEDIYEMLKKTSPEDLQKLIEAAEGMLGEKPKKKVKPKKEKSGDIGSMISEFLPLAVSALGNEDILGMAANLLGNNDGNNLTGMLSLAQSIFSQSKNAKQGNPMTSFLQLAALFTPDNMGGDNIHIGEVLQSASSFLGQSGLLGNQRGEKEPGYSYIIDLIAQYSGIDRATIATFQEVALELVAARDWKGFNSIMKKKVGFSLDETIALLGNTDVKTQVLKTYTPQLVDYIYDFFHPSNFETNLKYLSAISVSKGYEPIDPKQPKKSLAKFIDRIAKEQINLDPESIVYLDRIETNIRNMLRLDHDEKIDLSKVDKSMLIDKVSEIQREELLDPILETVQLYKKSSEYPECAKVLLCMANHPNNVATNVGFKGTVMRLTSGVVAWFLSDPKQGPKFADLYQAALDGEMNIDCEARYKGSCPTSVIGDNPFIMKLNYHSEL